MSDRTITELDEAECLRLIARGGIGRIAYHSRFGPEVLPVNYQWHDGAVVFRTVAHSVLDEDLQTGIAGGDYKVAFEIDDIDVAGRQGWSVLVQGPAHHVSGAERESAGARRLPQSLAEALDALEADQVLMTALGPLRSAGYLAVKRAEAAAFAEQDADWECFRHFLRF